MIARDFYIQIFWQKIFTSCFHYFFYFITALNQVFTVSFDDVQGNYILPVQAGVTFPLFCCINDGSDIFQVYGCTILISDDHTGNVSGRTELTFHLEVPAHITYFQQTTGNIEVLASDGTGYVIKCYSRTLHPEVIYVNLEFSFRGTNDFNPVNLF